MVSSTGKVTSGDGMFQAVNNRPRIVIALENEDVVRFLQGVAQGSVELSLFRRVELLGPQRLIGHVRRGPCTLGFKDSGCRCHRHAS